jgi:hypothetical protein
MRIKVDAWQCELTDCKHIWLATSDIPPSHCAKCRRRLWHSGLAAAKKLKKTVLKKRAARA